jgi:DNA invertase Pin-like site-specific DNA recombinase
MKAVIYSRVSTEGQDYQRQTEDLVKYANAMGYELKLWNKFGLLQCRNNRYFDKDKGLTFNWQKITEVLTNGKQW